MSTSRHIPLHARKGWGVVLSNWQHTSIVELYTCLLSTDCPLALPSSPVKIVDLASMGSFYLGMLDKKAILILNTMFMVCKGSSADLSEMNAPLSHSYSQEKAAPSKYEWVCQVAANDYARVSGTIALFVIFCVFSFLSLISFCEKRNNVQKGSRFSRPYLQKQIQLGPIMTAPGGLHMAVN